MKVNNRKESDNEKKKFFEKVIQSEEFYIKKVDVITVQF